MLSAVVVQPFLPYVDGEGSLLTCSRDDDAPVARVKGSGLGHL
jgi:hypothetical protein